MPIQTIRKRSNDLSFSSLDRESSLSVAAPSLAASTRHKWAAAVPECRRKVILAYFVLPLASRVSLTSK
jgi:hypothetical protein